VSNRCSPACRETRQKIQVAARGIEFAGSRGAEDIKPRDVIATAKCRQFRAVLVDEREHRTLLTKQSLDLRTPPL
jgi:hypothetical protein